MKRLNVDWMVESDLRECVAIDWDSYAEPWSRRHFLAALQHGEVGVVIREDGGAILGFAIYRIGSEDVSLVRLGVAKEHRRRGIGSALLRFLGSQIGQRSGLHIYLSEYAVGAQLFLKRCGLRWVSTYQSEGGRGEDVYLLVLTADQAQAVSTAQPTMEVAS